MPTTRSKGRSEPLQHLETPPKRQRKPKADRPICVTAIPQESSPRTVFLCPKQKNPRPFYRDASTQTDSSPILTLLRLAELRDRAMAPTSQKRNRDDALEDEPMPKRHQFSTPQNRQPNTLWMFGERINDNHPQTAPSKSLAGSTFRRPVRGPLARRINLAESSRSRSTPSSHLSKEAKFDGIKPIEQQVEKEDTEPQEVQVQHDTGISDHQAANEQAVPETPRRGLFGSIRGIVNKSWGFASSLTPRGTKPQPASADQASSETTNMAASQRHGRSDEVNYPDIDAVDGQANDDQATAQSTGARSRPDTTYDHLHYIPADSESVSKAITGEIAPPEAAVSLSPASRLKAKNPQLSDATIESILKRRERKAALDEQRYGSRPAPQSNNSVAPLFGPDSHYTRGTVDPRFLPAVPPYSSSRKRKVEANTQEAPATPSNRFSYVEDGSDQEDEIEINDDGQMERDEADHRPLKKQKSSAVLNGNSTNPATPRSAMKKPGMVGSIGRKSVAFGSSISRDIRGHYGPAGQYKGSTFADEIMDDSRSLSSIDHTDILSPTTHGNTITNAGKKVTSVLDNIGANVPKIDFTLRDPNDPTWRPSLGNPRPGAFRVPDLDEEDPDESMLDYDTPEQPQTPRISHAELPSAVTPVGSRSFNESSIIGESTELALDKARSKAEKYKPKSSSRLSEVSRARSRSTSPDVEEDELANTMIPAPASGNPYKTGWVAAAVPETTTKPREPHVPRVLDNTVKGTDGMTDYEREHQYDDWAASLKWDAPQTYEEAGTSSAFIQGLIRKNWTEEDSKRSEAFWTQEFDKVDGAMEAARARGQRLDLITGLEGIESY